MDVQSLPFNRSLGIKVDGDRIYLSPQERHLNHVGTVHATVIFGIAEAASGHILLRQFPSLSGTTVALLRASSTKFRQPADADTEIFGNGSINSDPDNFLATLQSRGRATVEVAVSVTQGDKEVLTGVFKWFAARQ